MTTWAERLQQMKEYNRNNPSTMREIYCGNAETFNGTLKIIKASLSQREPSLFILVGQPLTGKTKLQSELLREFEISLIEKTQEVTAHQLMVDMSSWDNSGQPREELVDDIRKLLKTIEEYQPEHALIIFSADINIYYPTMFVIIKNTLGMIDAMNQSEVPISVLVSLTAQSYNNKLPFFVEDPTLAKKLTMIQEIETNKTIRILKLPIDFDALVGGLWRLINSKQFNQEALKRESQEYFDEPYATTLFNILMELKRSGVNQQEFTDTISTTLQTIKHQALSSLPNAGKSSFSISA